MHGVGVGYKKMPEFTNNRQGTYHEVQELGIYIAYFKRLAVFGSANKGYKRPNKNMCRKVIANAKDVDGLHG
jgi:hypothetical protein